MTQVARQVSRRSTVVRYYTGTLGAGLSIDIEAYGDFVFLISNTGAANSLEMSFGNTQNQKTPVGLVLKSEEIFQRITLKNGDSVSTVYTLLVGQGDIDYKALVLSGSANVQIAAATTGTDGADITTGAAASILTALSTTKSIKLYADAANTAPVFIGYTASVSATNKSFAIPAGGMVILDNETAQLFAFSTVAQKLSVTRMV